MSYSIDRRDSFRKATEMAYKRPVDYRDHARVDLSRPKKKQKNTFMEDFAQNWKGFKKFMWNSEEGELLGRTAKGWVQITIFFIIFYAFLAGFFVGLLYLRLHFLPKDKPYRTDYLTHNGPGLNVVPYGRRYETNLFYDVHDQRTYSYLRERITDFFSAYTTINGEVSNSFNECIPDQRQLCEDGINSEDQEFIYLHAVPLSTNSSILSYNLNNLADCNIGQGFDPLNPCLYFTINKIRDYVPSTLNPHSRKDEMIIAETTLNIDDDFVPFVCRGKTEYDQSLIKIDMYPTYGFRRTKEYYPWDGNPDYRQPIVAAKIRPVVTDLSSGYNQPITVQCFILADNIFRNSGLQSVGMTEIKLKIMDHTKPGGELPRY